MDRIGERTMADHRAPGRLGWAFGAVAAVVLLTSAFAVASQWQRPSPGPARFVAAAAPSSSGHDFASLFHAR